MKRNFFATILRAIREAIPFSGTVVALYRGFREYIPPWLRLRQVADIAAGLESEPMEEFHHFLRTYDSDQNNFHKLDTSDIENVESWLDVGNEFTLAAASYLYYARFVGRRVSHFLPRYYVVDLIKRWVYTEQISELNAPMPDHLINELVNQKLLTPSSLEQHIDQPTGKVQVFKEGLLLRSVGKAAYLFEVCHETRPHRDHRVGELIRHIKSRRKDESE